MKSIKARVDELEAIYGKRFDVTPTLSITVLADTVLKAPLVGYRVLGGAEVRRKPGESDAELYGRALRGTDCASVVKTLLEIRGEKA